MKKQNKSLIMIFLLSIILILSLNEKVYSKSTFQKVEYSEAFRNWLELSDEEKEKVMQPRMFDIENINIPSKNPLYRANMLRSSINPRFSLKDIIPNNVVIKNQQNTGSCWTFAALSSLETNLALSNYKNGINQSKVYDFSERHMNYATSRIFENNEINDFGYNRQANDGGSWRYAHSYLTNGLGAVDELELPFENNENIININEIKNKVVSSQVYDTVEFPDYKFASTEERIQIINQIKQHIQNYGSVFASIHSNTSSTVPEPCYNNDTAAKYCNNLISHNSDHAISIIGWDDNYSVNNFIENARPKSNGAWIVRNSWGERLEYDLVDLKVKIFNIYYEDCIAHGWTNIASIPNEYLQQLGYTIENNKAYSKVGDNGLIYVSYEDINISSGMFGIQKATNSTNYEHIYQYDIYYPTQKVEMDEPDIMLCNIFNKKTSGTEYLNQVSLYTFDPCLCKVYVNPNGTGKTKDDLQLVSLKEGESKDITSGYHTLEFAKPIKLKSDNFVVVIEIIGSSNVSLALESKIDYMKDFDVVQVEKQKCFAISRGDFEFNEDWYDLGELGTEDHYLLDGDSTIKAFTISQAPEIVDDSLESIEITTPPTKTSYFEGDNFDKNGMVVKAYFNNNTSTTLDSSDYSILNGSNLKLNQNSVTIKYEDKTVEQPITVQPNNKDDEVAQNSNLNNSKCDIKNVQTYYFTNKPQEAYTLVNIEINNISRNLNNDKIEYYYYLSSNANEKNINNWIKISETQTSNDKLQFLIDSRDILNYNELSSENVLFLYVKEVAIKGRNQSISITKPMKLETDSNIEVFIDNKKSNGNSNTNTNTNTDSSTSNNSFVDKTTAGGKLPNTGVKFTIIVAIVVLLGIGIFLFIRYKKLINYMK